MSKFKTTLVYLISALALVLTPLTVEASSLQSRIEALNAQIAHNQSVLSSLHAKADTLQNRIDALNTQITQYQQEIDLTKLKVEQTQDKINQAIVELTKQKNIMFENARTLYKLGNPSAIEMLASSDSFTDFIDKQQYLTSVKQAVNDAADRILALKSQLEKRQADLKKYAEQQQLQQNLIVIARNQQAQLLNETKGEEAQYQGIVSKNKKTLQGLMAELARRSGGNLGGSTNYPYPHSCGDPYPDPWHSDGCPVHWSYIDRQCTSYAYWRRNAGFPNLKPVGEFWGNADQWDNSARYAGFQVNQSPSVGAVGVLDWAGFGHVFVVEAVNGDGSIVASQYNSSGSNGGQWGLFSQVTYSDLTGMWFIH